MNLKKVIKIAFFDAKTYDIESFNKNVNLFENYTFEIKYFSMRLNKDSVKLAKGFDVICAFVNDTLDANVLNELKNLEVKLVALRCAGYNNVDLHSAFEKIHIVRVPAYSPNAVAEYAVAMILSLNRKTYKAYNRTKDSNFSLDGLLGFDMINKTIGVIGTGKIGKIFANILKGFGSKILLYDKFQDLEFAKTNNFQYVELDTIFKNADIISLHCPLTPETKYIINENSIEKMKTGIMIINTGRGELINTKALIDGLKTKKIGSAGLDVYEEENEYFFEDFSSYGIKDDILARLLTFPNVLLTSHQAFFTNEALSNIAQITFKNIIDFFENQYLENEICYQCDKKNNSCQKNLKKRCF